MRIEAEGVSNMQEAKAQSKKKHQEENAEKLFPRDNL